MILNKKFILGQVLLLICLIVLRTQAYDLLIISPKIFAQQITDFAEWKNSYGISTQIKYVEDLSEDYPHTNFVTAQMVATTIKHCIDQEFVNNDISYVLLVGNSIYVPYMEFRLAPFNKYCPSDSKYSLISNDDFVPEIAVGRMPASDASQLERMLEKSKCMGLNNAHTLIAGSETIFDNTMFKIKEKYAQHVNFELILSSQGGTNADIFGAFNNNKNSVIVFNGHGTPFGFVRWNVPEESFYYGEASILTNNIVFPIVYSSCCLMALREIESELMAAIESQGFTNSGQGCFGKTIVESQHAGSIFIGHNEEANKQLVQQRIENFYDAIYTHSMETIGQAFHYSLAKFILANTPFTLLYGGDIYSLYPEADVLISELYGDPSAKLNYLLTGEISGTVTLSKKYFVPANGELKILPGAKIIYNEGFELNIAGKLISTESIENVANVFEANSAGDGWSGIRFLKDSQYEQQGTSIVKKR